MIIDNLKGAGKDTQITSKNQPSPEAKSEGVKQWWDRRKFKNELFQEFAKPLTPEGVDTPTFEAGVELYKRAIFHKDSGLSIKERADMFIKFCDFVGINEQKINQTSTSEVTLKNKIDTSKLSDKTLADLLLARDNAINSE